MRISIAKIGPAGTSSIASSSINSSANSASLSLIEPAVIQITNPLATANPNTKPIGLILPGFFIAIHATPADGSAIASMTRINENV